MSTGESAGSKDKRFVMAVLASIGISVLVFAWAFTARIGLGSGSRFLSQSPVPDSARGMRPISRVLSRSPESHPMLTRRSLFG